MDFERDTFRIEEIHAMNGNAFPFWVRPWKTVHSIAKITHASYQSGANGRLWFCYHGERWTVDGSISLKQEIMIQVDGLPGWLPVRVDSDIN